MCGGENETFLIAYFRLTTFTCWHRKARRFCSVSMITTIIIAAMVRTRKISMPLG